MNWLLIGALIILVWRIAEGVRRGMVKEIISFVSLIVLCLVVGLLGTALSRYMEKDIASMIVAVILLLLVLLVHKLLGIVFFSAKLMAKLPVLHTADKLLGAVIGVLETVIILWTLFTLVMTFDMGVAEQFIVAYTNDSGVLTFLSKYNLLQNLVDVITAKWNLTGGIL